jgi:membrane-associated protein
MTLDTLITFLEAHQSLTLIVLLAGAYFETVIITSFFVYGEFFFLAGAILAGLGVANLLEVAIVLYIGGILGDHTSYWIGRKWGGVLYEKMGEISVLKRHFTHARYVRGTTFFEKYGGSSVLIGRFLGPVAWITPFLAGTFKLSYTRFTLFDFPAVIFGIGQFILVGYIFGRHYQTFLNVIHQYLLSVIFVCVVAGVIWFFNRRRLQRLGTTFKQAVLDYIFNVRHRKIHAFVRTLKIAGAILLVVSVLYAFFLASVFFLGKHAHLKRMPANLHSTYTDITSLIDSIDTTTYYVKGTDNIGPINVLLIGEGAVDTVFTDANWSQSKTILRNDIHIGTYIIDALHFDLPISDQYFKGVPQNSVYIYNIGNTLFTRVHARVWVYGTLNDVPVYAVSVSKDSGFELYRDRTFIVPLHELDENIDASRELLVESIRTRFPHIKTEMYLSATGAQQQKDDSFYYTDGMIDVMHF